jgi:catechol 2,3-dioxygenase-like lactoylglutathione lyase family enzyme
MAHLGLTKILVHDQTEAIAFYAGKCGFELREDTDLGNGVRWVVVAPPGAQTGLLLSAATTPEAVERVGNQTGGTVGWFLNTTDFARDYERMRDAGVKFLEEPRHEVYGSVAVFEDLYGNKWDLIQPK